MKSYFIILVTDIVILFAQRAAFCFHYILYARNGGVELVSRLLYTLQYFPLFTVLQQSKIERNSDNKHCSQNNYASE